MRACVFPGQGTQFAGMGKSLYASSKLAARMFGEANEILGFDITKLMFTGKEKDLQQTEISQPAIFLHSVILVATLGDQFAPSMVAGHSLGELTALTAIKVLSFKEGLQLVAARAKAMQKACNACHSTMVVIMGLSNEAVEEALESVDGVVPANYNSPDQIVISGSINNVEIACQKLLVAGAKRIIPLNVSGAFHSPLMETARVEFAEAVSRVTLDQPIYPVYQNVDAKPTIDPNVIRQNLIAQIVSPVLWYQTIQRMMTDGADTFVEIGPGNVLRNLIRRISPTVTVLGIS